MLLGKRPRYHPMKRTTSMTEFTFDPVHANPADQIDGFSDGGGGGKSGAVLPHPSYLNNPFSGTGAGAASVDQGSVASASMALLTGAAVGSGGVHHIQRRHSADSVQNFNVSGVDHVTPHFLRDCSLCKRRLVPGRDIYMYRGDSAFCSLECRQQRMSQDLRKEKCSLASAANANKEKASSSSSSAKVSNNGVAAAATAATI